MGSSESKINKDESEVPSTPIQCRTKPSIVKNLSEMDPRSPNVCIARTPIEVPILSSNEGEVETDISRAEAVVDPRSPSDEFPRTPIFIQYSVSPQPPLKLHNKILDNARRNIIYTPTLTSKTHKDFQLNSSPIPPKLLESSPISRKNIDNRKSFVGLLETNIDYRETDLDNYIITKSLSSGLTINTNENFLSGSIIKQENCDPRSPSTEFLRTPIQVLKKVGEVDLNNIGNDGIQDDDQEGRVDYNSESLLKIANLNMELIEDETEEAITLKNIKEGILEVNNDIQTISDDFETIVQENFDDMNKDEVDNSPSSFIEDDVISEEIVQIMNNLVDHVETVTLIENENREKSPLSLKEYEMKHPVIDLTADVREFDRKLTKIIYENEETFSFKRTPKNDKDEKPRNRTPMKDRNIIDEPKKTKLRVSDKPRKLDVVSKIPVSREKHCTKKIQCENTIPVSMGVKKKRKSHQPKWDSDKTLVI